MQHLQKRSDSSQSLSSKYFINCRLITKEQPTTQAWLTILKQLKPTNFDDKNRIILGVLDKGKDVVIKIGESETLEKEYKISHELFKKGVEGFIKYSCFFKCDDDYKEHTSSRRQHLCKRPGSRMSCLVMPYLKFGSVKSFDFRAIDNGLIILKSLLKVIFTSVVRAFNEIGLVHNDLHSQNVLVTMKRKHTMNNVSIHSYGIVILDFENALLSDNKNEHKMFVFKDYGRLLADIHYTTNLNLKKMFIYINGCH